MKQRSIMALGHSLVQASEDGILSSHYAKALGTRSTALKMHKMGLPSPHRDPVGQAV